MTGEWAQAPLRDLIELTRDGEWGSDQPGTERVEMLVVRGTDFARLGLGDLAEIPRRYIERGAAERKQLRANDVLIETAGGTKDQSTGRTALVKQSHIERAGLPLTCASFARFLRFDRAKVEPAFMYWWLQSLHASGEMETHQVQHTGVARFQFTKFAESTNAPLPPLAEQRAIACILGSLDDKIELNRRMNETLEAMARAIFKSWFVDFAPVRAKAEGRDTALPKHIADLFPHRFEDSELGEIPSGWKVWRVADVGNVVCGKTPSTVVADYYGDDIPFITIPDMHGKIFATKVQRKLSLSGATSQKNKMLPAGAICVSCIATPGLVVITSKRSQTNQQINTIVPSSAHETYFWYWIFRDLGDDVRAGGSGGSVLTNLSTGRFSELHVLAPLADLRVLYHGIVAPLFDRILANERDSATLAALRDTLLPKLISGDLRVPDTETFIEAAI